MFLILQLVVTLYSLPERIYFSDLYSSSKVFNIDYDLGVNKTLVGMLININHLLWKSCMVFIKK